MEDFNAEMLYVDEWGDTEPCTVIGCCVGNRDLAII